MATDDHEETQRLQRLRDRDRRTSLHPPVTSGAELVTGDEEAIAVWEGEGSASLTPVDSKTIDPIEVTAMRVQRRSEAIQNRPGASPTADAVSTAVTVHVVRGELNQFKGEITKKVDDLGTKVDGVSHSVITGLLAEQNRQREIEHLAKKSEIEITTHSKVTEIEIGAAAKKSKIEIRTKMWLWGLSILSAALGALHLIRC